MDTFDFLDSLIFAVRCHDQCCKCLLEKYKLRASELDVLMFLSVHPDAQTAKDICESRLVAKSLVSTSVEALVKRDLISRSTDTADRRRTLLHLRPEADEIVARALEITKSFQSRCCEGIADEDMQTFDRVFTQMRHNMNEIIAAD